MRIILLLLICSILFAGKATYCQNQSGDLIYFVNADAIWDIARDGNIFWIATFGGGLVKYNKITGEKTNYLRSNSSITSHLLTSVAIDSNRTIWIGTNSKGILSFD